MTNDDDSGQDASPEEEETLLEQFTRSAQERIPQMTIGRYTEIEQLDQEDRLEELSAEELEEYRVLQERFAELSRTASKALNRQLKPTTDGLSNIRDTLDTLKFREPEKHGDSTLNIKPMRRPDIEAAALLGQIVDLLDETLKLGEQNADHLALAAQTLVELRGMRSDADSQQEAQNTFNKRMSWVALLLATAAVVVPFLILLIEQSIVS